MTRVWRPRRDPISQLEIEERMCVVTLECGCSQVHAPGHRYTRQNTDETGPSAYCDNCRAITHVVKVVGPWMWQCLDCPKEGNTGVMRQTAWMRATQHGKTRSHRTFYWRYGDPKTKAVIELTDPIPGL
jgi:hypothetical protein